MNQSPPKPSPVDRRHCTLALQEISAADELLSHYLGPNHTARKDLARLIKDLREKLSGAIDRV